MNRRHRTAPAGTGWEGGRLVPVVFDNGGADEHGPDAESSEGAVKILDLLFYRVLEIRGHRTAPPEAFRRNLGTRVAATAWLLYGPLCGSRTQGELAGKLGVTLPRFNKEISRCRERLKQERSLRCPSN